MNVASVRTRERRRGRAVCGRGGVAAGQRARHAGRAGILRRVLAKLRAAFSAATGRVRLDGGFAHPKLFAWLERQQVEYVVAMASNPRLEKRARRLRSSPRAWSWAALMHRAFAIDVLACPNCGGRLRLIGTLHDQAVIRKILAHVGCPPQGQHGRLALLDDVLRPPDGAGGVRCRPGASSQDDARGHFLRERALPLTYLWRTLAIRL